MTIHMKSSLSIHHLNTFVGEKQILFDISCVFQKGQITVLMGPNGSGKSTLAHALMGDAKYRGQRSEDRKQKTGTVYDSSSIRLDGKDIAHLSVDKRAKKGLFLSFQSPAAVPGVSVIDILKSAMEKKESKAFFQHTLKEIHAQSKFLHIDTSLLTRSIHDGFSGGEQKKIELLQALILKPFVAIFDEIDTGVDADALRLIALGVKKLKRQGTGIILITHNDRIIKYLDVQRVLVMKKGKIVKDAGKELIKEINDKGYGGIS